MSFFNFVSNGLKRIDLYAYSIELTFKGKKKISTPIGRGATIGVGMIWLLYFIYRLVLMVQLDEYRSRSTQVQATFNYSDPQLIAFNELGFDLAINTIKPITDEYGRIEVRLDRLNNNLNETDGTISRTKDKEILELVQCNDTGFNYTDMEEYNLKGIPNFKCVKNKEKFLFGGTFQAIFY